MDGLVILTSTPGMRAPLVSVTLPVIVPVVADCGNIRTVTASMKNVNAIIRLNFRTAILDLLHPETKGNTFSELEKFGGTVACRITKVTRKADVKPRLNKQIALG